MFIFFMHYVYTIEQVKIQLIEKISYSLLSFLKLLEGFQDLVGGLWDGEGSHVAGRVDPGSQGVDLADCEPGQGGEHEVEQSLANTDHDVLVLEDASLDGLPVPGPPVAGQEPRQPVVCPGHLLALSLLSPQRSLPVLGRSVRLLGLLGHHQAGQEDQAGEKDERVHDGVVCEEVRVGLIT